MVLFPIYVSRSPCMKNISRLKMKRNYRLNCFPLNIDKKRNCDLNLSRGDIEVISSIGISKSRTLRSSGIGIPKSVNAICEKTRKIMTQSLIYIGYTGDLRPCDLLASEIALYATIQGSKVQHKFFQLTMLVGCLFLFAAPINRPFCQLAMAKSFESCHEAHRRQHPFHRLCAKKK